MKEGGGGYVTQVPPLEPSSYDTVGEAEAEGGARALSTYLEVPLTRRERGVGRGRKRERGVWHMRCIFGICTDVVPISECTHVCV